MGKRFHSSAGFLIAGRGGLMVTMMPRVEKAVALFVLLPLWIRVVRCQCPCLTGGMYKRRPIPTHRFLIQV